MKKIILIVLALFLAASIFVYEAGYHGPRDFPCARGTLSAPETVVKHARSLTGTPYDPLRGRWNNVGARAGFIVCSDVPNIAYGLSGFSLRRMLEKDYDKNSAAYDTSRGNKPGNPYFHRRARNLYAYFKGTGRLVSSKETPRVGDLAFYRRKPDGYVSHVTLVTKVKRTGYSVMESAPELIFAREVSGSSPIERGRILLGFGRMSPALTVTGRLDNGNLGECVVRAAGKQIGKTIHYDPSYQVLKYPNGDVPPERGVCTDVVIRALRSALGWDLQKLVHEDMRRNFSRYPQKWGLKGPDKNIDHRRVPNLKTYFKRMGCSRKVTKNPTDYNPGDLVTCIVPPNLPHIMIVSHPTRPNGRPRVIHNIGSGTREEDRLFEFKLTGHYRLRAKPTGKR